MKVICPAAFGNGAFLVHRQLQRDIDGYDLRAYSPLWELFPPAIRWFSRGKADLVHAPAEYGMFSRRRGVPQVLTLHGYNLDAAFRPYANMLQRLHYAADLRWFMRRSLLGATAVVAVSRTTAELAQQDLGISRTIRVIPNGVDLTRFTPGGRRRSRTVRVLFSGNLTRRKGAHLLPALVERFDPDVRLVCASGLRGGGAPPFDHSQVEWLGAISPQSMPDVYRSVDMLVMPSFREGLSLTVLEAMASGLPVIASETSSMPEQVHAGKGGWLCPPGNVEAFAARINALAALPDKRAEMGEYNRARTEMDYDEKEMVRRYAALFESVLS